MLTIEVKYTCEFCEASFTADREISTSRVGLDFVGESVYEPEGWTWLLHSPSYRDDYRWEESFTSTGCACCPACQDARPDIRRRK